MRLWRRVQCWFEWRFRPWWFDVKLNHRGPKWLRVVVSIVRNEWRLSHEYRMGNSAWDLLMPPEYHAHRWCKKNIKIANDNSIIEV